MLAGGTEPLGYQWFKNGVALADGGNIAGALTSTLIVSNVLRGDAGWLQRRGQQCLGQRDQRGGDADGLIPFITSQPASQNSESRARA